MFWRGALSHLFEPLECIVGEVVPLGVGKNVLGQGREDGLKVGTLGGGSHDQTDTEEQGRVKGKECTPYGYRFSPAEGHRAWRVWPVCMLTIAAIASCIFLDLAVAPKGFGDLRSVAFMILRARQILVLRAPPVGSA